ncbi:hypothetical protein PQQ32_11950 [Brachyspira hyodysenteriae]|uniref:Uncharacterized protein n=4 Tax=Brachyspira hyodysenteriae TaxID=159 RepID=A0A3B6VQH4_BRAHO|nr:hypothetical protein [Brachyspira hyodysenteriae]ANN62927.1 hypothetical protein BHYOB78_03340 [Brachyspira hyodysenteriae ATCC 27164]KLI24993.1 hypothetical protein SZ47_08550 [Brachyspira hyodysenteriae]KLI57815.1 hypothetical protein SZ44_12040 [Brachyspira hyodysenteriae]MDA0035840.1 hypothetical protein [Brachyspira hyodysenteriae]MDA0039758.1 hypothetical protein [Brachyspira hyodysenteriae]
MTSEQINYITNQLNNILNTDFNNCKDKISEVCKDFDKDISKINSDTEVFDFDKITLNIKKNNRPKSADMIHIQNNIIYLIEFKNTSLLINSENSKDFKQKLKNEIKLKGIESLITIHKIINKMIDANIKFNSILDLNIYYYLIANENSENNTSENKENRNRINMNEDCARLTTDYKSRYFKDVKISSFESFEKDFILKYF